MSTYVFIYVLEFVGSSRSVCLVYYVITKVRNLSLVSWKATDSPNVHHETQNLTVTVNMESFWGQRLEESVALHISPHENISSSPHVLTGNKTI